MSVLQTMTNSRSPAAVLADWWHEWMRAATCASDLADCPDEEVEHIAKDVGVSVSELRWLARHKADDADLLLRRMAALDLSSEEVDKVERATFLDLQRVCTVCNCKRRCMRDMARNANDAVWEDYCPNVATLKMLDAMPWSSRREW